MKFEIANGGLLPLTQWKGRPTCVLRTQGQEMGELEELGNTAVYWKEKASWKGLSSALNAS